MIVDTSNMTIKEIYASKHQLIATKKQAPIFSEAVSYVTKNSLRPVIETKEDGEGSKDPNKLKVSFIGNTSMFCDSHMDVLSVGCYDKTLNERGRLSPHLIDHKHTVEAMIGKPSNIYTELIDVKEFGIESDVLKTEVLKMDSELVRSWNPKVFQLYKDGAINQHSIGMQYLQLELALNDEEYKDEFSLWNKVFPKIINKEFVAERGYFWHVTEIKLFEISAVLFGANELTPTTAIEATKEVKQPTKDVTVETKTDEADLITSEKEQELRKKALLENY